MTYIDERGRLCTNSGRVLEYKNEKQARSPADWTERAWTAVQKWVDDIRIEVSVCSCHCHEPSKPNEEVLVEYVAALAAEAYENGLEAAAQLCRGNAVIPHYAYSREEWAVREILAAGIRALKSRPAKEE